MTQSAKQDIFRRLVLLTCALFAGLTAVGLAYGEVIGDVNTVYKFMSPDHKIVIEAFDDPKVAGVTCHVSRAKTGGFKGALGLAEDPSDAAIACRQVGPINIKEKLDDGEEVFSQRTSLVFKELHVVRFLDEKRNVLVYLAYSDKLIEGSPKNSISTVPIQPWP